MIIIVLLNKVGTNVGQESIDTLNEIEDETLEDDCGFCQTVHVKDCTITMKKVVTPVMVRKCVTRKVVAERGNCVGGVRTKCSIR